MSLKNILTGLGRRILGGKKESATPATGQQQRQITYEPKPSQAQGQELATREIRNPPVVLKKTKPLQMGDDIAPAFGSSTYDWAMRIGRSKYSADEWLNHLTSTRKVNFKIFGKPATKTVREPKRFKYDSGPFAGKEVNVSREELFDSNLAIFNDAGDLTGGLLYAAKKFGLKLDANEVGAVLKLNPINRLQAIELGVQKGAKETFDKAFDNLKNTIQGFKMKYRADDDLVSNFDDALYQMGSIKGGELGKGVFSNLRDALKAVLARPVMSPNEKALFNKLESELINATAPLKRTKTKYQNETPYTLQGGKDYRETIFHLPEDIVTNSQLRDKGGHFSDILPNTNNIYHIRYDTRFTPEGKKVFMINEIQSDVNQSISKALQKNQQLSGEFRTNPFNADIELNLLINRRGKLINDLNEAIDVQDFGRVNAIKSTLDNVNKKLTKMTTPRSGEMKDYFPMVESDAYADHAIKYLSQKAARENVDFIAVAPFDKLSFRQGYKAGNERFYGYANGKGINKKGKAILPDVMSRLARFFDTKAGPTKISYSDPKIPYKKQATDKFKYPENVQKGKTINSTYHADVENYPARGYVNIPEGDPRLYFDAFAIKVTPMMRQTQKTYKSQGGLVVDIFNTMRYN